MGALQFELTSPSGVAILDISSYAFDKKVTRRLNLPWTASCRVPSSYLTYPMAGYQRLKVRLNGSIFFNGFVYEVGDDGDETGVPTTEITAIDPMIWWKGRPARDADGDFSLPSFFTDYLYGPQIMRAIIDNSETWEGSLGVSIGSVATGGVSLAGAPANWPMTVGDVATMLTATGELDIVLTPLDGGADMAQVNLYNGNYGSNLSGSVVFDYGTGQYNVRQIRRTESMANLCNKLWYYLGPKIDDQHWRGNVTGDATGSYNPPGGDVDYANPLGNLINTSRSALGVWMDVKIHDDLGVENSLRPLYTRMWQTEQTLRVTPRLMLYITPVRGVAPTFDIGDRVTINAGAALRGGFTGATQRIYGYTVAESNEGVIEVVDFVASPDGDTV